MRRREFVKLSVAAVAYAPFATDLAAAVGARDESALTAIQTSHETDLALASLVDCGGVRQLNRWMSDGADPILRVNAAGILAKLPGQDAAAAIEAALAGDADVREKVPDGGPAPRLRDPVGSSRRGRPRAWPCSGPAVRIRGAADGRSPKSPRRRGSVVPCGVASRSPRPARLGSGHACARSPRR